jgi:hypothetical protein
MEDLLCGWWLVRLSTALIDVICLKRGTTCVTVLSMLLMRHERRRNDATGILEESGRPGGEVLVQEMKARPPREFLRIVGDIFSPEELRLALNWNSIGA